MQKTLIGLLSVAVVVLALAFAWQTKQLRHAETHARAAQESLATQNGADEAQAQRIAELERGNARLEKQVAQFASVTTSLRTNETALRSNATALAERIKAAGGTDAEREGEGLFGKGMGDMIGKMMKDPAMREMMREQQKVAINMMYGGLFKELNLSPEEKEKLKDLLTDSQMGNVEAAQGLFGGTQDEAAVAAAKKATAEAKKQTDADLKALLGDERFAQYQDYEKNIGDRMQLDQFKTQLAADSTPLRDDQNAQLLQIMKEEKLALPPAIPEAQSEMPDKDTFTAQKMDEQLKWMEQYNARVADRAKGVLTPEQFINYQKFQEQQASMSKLGLQMARQMFGGDKGKPAAK
jgi:hypothetical protein